MNKNKILSIISVLLCVALLFCACTAGSDDTTEAGVVTRAVEEESEAEAVSLEAEEISFYEVTDGDYKIKISPIYKSDGKTVVAAYIISVTDKDNKEVKADKFPMLMSIVAATNTKTAIALTKDKSKNYIKINSYADENGNLLVVQDSADANKNGKKDEYLKLTKVTNDEGSTHYLLTDTVIEIVTEGKNVYAVISGKKIKVDTVDSDNKKVKVTVEKQTALDKETASEKKKKATTTTTTKAADTNDKTKAYNQIILLKNGKASSTASGVTTSSNLVSITGGGDYLITSKTSDWHGIIKLEIGADDEAELRFEDVNISYNKGSIIQIIDSSDTTTDRSFLEAEASSDVLADDTLNDTMEDLSDRESAPNVSLSFPSGTTSTFTSSANVYSGVIYNESKLTVKGNGKVNFKATTNANNVICSSKSITFKNVSAYLQSAAFGVSEGIGGSRGIFSYGKVNLDSGSLTIETNGDSIRCTRFTQEDGTLTATSSACDGIDTESSISIYGGKATVTALQKSSFKVRRVNIQERWDNGERVSKKDCIREGRDDGFYIFGGTVRGESKKVSDYKMSPSQKTIVCRTVKKTKGSATEVKKAVKWKVGSLASSNNSCIKFLYSSSAVKRNEYNVTVDGSSKAYNWKWSNNHGACYVEYTTSK